MVDPTILMTINNLSSQQSYPTINNMRNIKQLLYYCNTLPTTIIRYNKSDIILKVHSDSGYLNVMGSKSRSGVMFYLGNNPVTSNENNGNILIN